MKIIYVDVDSLRPDHTGPYGYERSITPNLDEMARNSVMFDRYYCSDSPCLPSRTALTSGQHGITNGVVGHFGDDARFRLDAGHGPQPGRPLLGQALCAAGYTCAAVSSFAERHRADYFMGNFRETVQVTPDIGDEPADMITDAALKWIERHRDVKDWYLHVTYWDPHTDYLQDESWTAKAAASGPAPAWPDPVQGSLQAGPTLYNQPEAYMEHLRSTGRSHLAEDLRERLQPNQGATQVSWHAQVPVSAKDRAAMRRRRELALGKTK
jgi:arylsulfatase A-like enzyme